ncbi:MAG: GNAT family N-acetyltransferase [Acidiphilium sp.]
MQPESLLHPNRILLSGATTKHGISLRHSLAAGAFTGTVTETLTDQLDLALIADHADDVPKALARLTGKLNGPAIIYADIDTETLRTAARAAHIRVIGGRSFGIANPAIGLNALLAPRPAPPGRVALLSQSAAIARAVIDWAEPNGVGFSHIVGIGSNADIGFGRLLDNLARDPGTGLILLDIAQLRDPRLFLSAARAAARLRPIIALAPGARLADPSALGLRAYEAALSRAGILLTTRFDAFLATAETLIRARPAQGSSLSILGNGLGVARLAADAALAAGLTLTTLTDETRRVLSLGLAQAPDASGPIAVLDVAGTKLADLAALLAGAPEVGGILVVHAPSHNQDDDAAIDALIACARSITKPLLVAVLGEATGGPLRHRLSAAGLAAFATPEDAVSGFADLLRHRDARATARELPPSTIVEITPDATTIRALFADVTRAHQTWLGQSQAFSLLAAYGIAAPPYRITTDPDGVAAAAAELGFPVVVKLSHPDFAHHRPHGSVALDLPDQASAHAAATVITTRLQQRGAWPDGALFVVQSQIQPARELSIRVKSHPIFGPIISLGPGGRDPTERSDNAVELLPLNLALAQALITRAGGDNLLRLRRGLALANRDALATTLVRASQLIIDWPNIASLEIDPLFATPTGIAAASARIHLRPEGEPAIPLAIRPYPAHRVEFLTLHNRPFIIRPIRPEDAAAHADLFARIPAEDIRRRFFSAMRSLTPEQIIRMTEIDYTRELALIATDPPTPDAPHPPTHAVARLVGSDTDGAQAEFAILVEPAAKHLGLGEALMHRLIDWARAEGVQTIIGEILAENTPMLAFVQHLGFSLHHSQDDADIIEARLNLA